MAADVTMASWRPMLPTVTPPEKNMHGSQERTYKKSGDVYLKKRQKNKTKKPSLLDNCYYCGINGLQLTGQLF